MTGEQGNTGVEKVLLDPYARAVAVGANYAREAVARPGDNCAHAMKGMVVYPSAYDKALFAPAGLPNPVARAWIWRSRPSEWDKCDCPKKIPYLQSLEVTAVELLPVQQFDEQDAPPGLTNYWGYSPVAFFAPHQGYCSCSDPLGPVNEFRDMVKALHRAGIEVILDVVFNHTAERDHTGPVLSFRGLENRAYYILEANRASYANYSGCGNTVNANHSIAGSPDLYRQPDREPNRSTNFVTCHDGFTLNDLVSYNEKHNEANAKTTTPGRMPTSVGTATWRGRPMIWRWRRCGCGRSGTT